MKILLTFGTRPEAIKLAPIYHILKSQPNRFETLVCVTGQHREMLDQALDIFKIKSDIDLDVMSENQSLCKLASKILTRLEPQLEKIQPDVLLVHGDTTTSVAAALAGFYKGIKIAHIEAGLRTNNLYSPFPEEFNRQAISRIASWHFAPTERSRENLIRENILEKNIFVTGNTVIDSLYYSLRVIEQNESLKKKIAKNLNEKLNFLWASEKFILITGHRRESFGDGFREICFSIKRLAKKYPCFRFVYTLHLNPNVRKIVVDNLKDQKNIYLINPLDYQSFIYLIKKCYLVLTDSGGIQEEAPSLCKPVLVMRNQTERPEGIEAGTLKLVGTQSKNIISNTSALIDDQKLYDSMAGSKNPYGDGKASKRIVKILGK